MALEYAPTIRFNCIAPAVGNTSMCVQIKSQVAEENSIERHETYDCRLQASIGNRADSKERLLKIEDTLPMKRVAQPVDIANGVWYLASEQSSFVTGTMLDIDGGRGV